MAKSKSSWIQRHLSDPYVKKAQQQGFLSRAVYKLQEIQQKYPLILPGMKVVELGAAPGGWSQYVAQMLKGHGTLIAVDLLPMAPLTGVLNIQGDFNTTETLEQIRKLMAGQPLDLVLSDMAPNITGMKAVDQARMATLAEAALSFAEETLKPGGNFFIKVFEGSGIKDLQRELKNKFQHVSVEKPKASRARSSEIYLLAKNFHL